MNILNSLNILILADIPEDYLEIKTIFKEIEGGKQQLYWSKSLTEIPEVKFDLIFYTINKSDIDLSESFSKLNCVLGQLPIIALTSNSDLNFTIKLLEHGAKDVLIKGDLNKAQLYKTVFIACDKLKK